MKMYLIYVGSKMPTWVQQGTTDYLKRLPKNFSVECINITTQKRHKNADVQQIKQQETLALLAAVPQRSHIIALDQTGNNWSTHELAHRIQDCAMNSIAFLIGGPDGLTRECLTTANAVWSLSALTLPHTLARLIVVEAIYRAWTILNKHPYHRN